MNEQTTIEHQQTLLADIGILTDRLRQLRATPHLDSTRVRALEAEARTKWAELRVARAGPIEGDMTRPDPKGHYR